MLSNYDRGAEMSTTRSLIKHLKPGKYCVLDGEPCKVIDVTVSKAGKHGHAKARLVAVGVFDGKKRDIVKTADSEIEVPIIDKRVGQVVAITGDEVQIMDMETYETFEAKVPEELKDKITQGCEVQYWVLLGRKLIVGVR